jgi:hypothetical protein
MRKHALVRAREVPIRSGARTPESLARISVRGSRLDTIATERWQTAAPTNKYCDSLPFINAKANVLALGIVGFGVAYGLPKVLML